MNPLLTAAMPLLLLMIKLKNMEPPSNIAELRHKIINDIHTFETRAKSLQCQPRQILAGRYCICTALDEMVLSTAWGSTSIWSQQSLLSLIHKETWGGERFFIILEKMAEEPQQNLFLLELIYIILSLGFEGKYYNEERMAKEEIRQRLFRAIMSVRPEPSKILSPGFFPIKIPEYNKKQKKLIFSVIAILLTLFITFNTVTYFKSQKVLHEINRMIL